MYALARFRFLNNVMERDAALEIAKADAAALRAMFLDGTLIDVDAESNENKLEEGSPEQEQLF